jgi:exodeoxyribonuclease VII large subunit
VDFKRSALLALERGLGNPRHAIEAQTQRLDGLSERLESGGRMFLDRRGQAVTSLGARLRHPLQQVEDARRRLAMLGPPLDAGMRRVLETAGARLERWSDLLESYSYRGVLKRGFALITNRSGHAIGAAAETEAGMKLDIRFHDGARAAIIEELGDTTPRGRSVKADPAKPAGQGRLF